jgi:hypothetical protein
LINPEDMMPAGGKEGALKMNAVKSGVIEICFSLSDIADVVALPTVTAMVSLSAE